MPLFCDNPSWFARFPARPETEFVVYILGYNDFHYIAPMTQPRTITQYTVHLVLHGSGKLILNGKEYAVGAQNLFFTPPGVSLCYYPNQDDPWDYIWFGFDGSRSDAYVQEMGLTLEHPVQRCRDFQQVYLDFSSLFGRLQRESGAGYYAVLAAFYRLMACQAEPKLPREEDLGETVLSYLDCHYHEPELTIADIADYFGFSHSHFCRLVKQSTGKTAMDLLIEARVREACRLLENSALSIKEIAYSVGFGDETHFIKTFKRHAGLTAREYRRQHRQLR